MKIVLFDLGRTLEHNDVLLPGAVQTLEAIGNLRDMDGQPVAMGLVSDFDMPQTPADVPAIRQSYLAILEQLGIRRFFEPADRCVTLSTDVGVFKPDERVFRAALDRFVPNLPFTAALFVSENLSHVSAARALGMRAVHFKGPGQMTGDITQLLDLVPLIEEFAAPSDTSWARLGDDVFRFGTSAGARVAAAPGRDVPREHLHLVVQKGRLFQKAHPDIPVLHDRGRFLVVALDPATAKRIGQPEEPCFVVRPLTDRHVAFEARPRTAVRAAEVPWVRALVDGVTRPPYEADLTHLVSFPTRHSTTAHYTAAAEWAGGRLEEMGYQVTQTTITVGSGTSRNVIADRLGKRPGPRGMVLVTAHLDSVNHDVAGPLAPAPGADDNASGSAGVLQIARSLRDHANADDLRFILFGGEEQGLFGSKQYVAGLSTAERGRVRAVVNMDMIGCLNRAPATVLIEGAAVSPTVINGLAEAAGTYTGLSVETSLDPFASDHVPFIQANLPAVLTIEGADQSNPNDHTSNDVLANVNYDIALEILRMNLAFVALTVGKVESNTG